jgi:hypothetical protein
MTEIESRFEDLRAEYDRARERGFDELDQPALLDVANRARDLADALELLDVADRARDLGDALELLVALAER